MAVTASARRRTVLAWRVAFALCLLVQLVVLYAPRSPGEGGLFPQSDKVVHLLVFGAVAFTAIRAGARWRPVLALLVAHAVVSELIQHFLLSHRDGDVWDAVADTIGVAVGAWLASRARRVTG